MKDDRNVWANLGYYDYFFIPVIQCNQLDRTEGKDLIERINQRKGI